jgi:hypothetical protein
MKLSRLSLFELRLSEIWDEPIAKVALGFAVALAVLAGLFALGFIPDPMRAGGRGPGWECDATRPAAVICVKDVKPPAPGKKGSN